MVSLSQPESGLRVTLDIWHPDCWTLSVTEGADAGLLGHGVYHIDGMATGRFTVYAETTAAVESLITAVRASPLTESVWETDGQHATDATAPGSASRAIVVRYAIENSINDALVSRGFIPDEPVRMHDGREYWTVLVNGSRTVLDERVEAVRTEWTRRSKSSISPPPTPPAAFFRRTTSPSVSARPSISHDGGTTMSGRAK